MNFNLNKNQIEEIDDESFSSSIQPINSYIMLTNDQPFRGQSNLIELDLSNNRIQLLKKNTFRGLTSLNNLNLSFNKIIEIFENEFHFLVNLKHLSINDNQIMHIHSDAFRGLVELRRIEMFNNKLFVNNSNIFLYFEEDIDLKNIFINNQENDSNQKSIINKVRNIYFLILKYLYKINY